MRLYAGMFWSGMSGSALAAFLAFVSVCAQLRFEWTAILSGYSLIAALLFFIFALQLRKVRGQEVESVFVSYLQVIRKVSPAVQGGMAAAPEQTIDHKLHNA